MSYRVALVALVVAASGPLLRGQESPKRPAAALALEDALRARLGQAMERLDIDLAMFGDDFFGTQPQAVRWSRAGDSLEFRWKRWEEREVGWWRYTVATATLARLAPGEEERPEADATADGTTWVWVLGSSLRLQRKDQDARTLLRWSAPIEDVVLEPNGRRVIFRSDGGIYAVDTEGGALQQLLKLVPGDTSKDKKLEKDKSIKTIAAWHKARQLELFRVLWEAEEAREKSNKETEERKRRLEIPSFGPPAGFRIESSSPSPDGTRVVFGLVETARKARSAAMPDYVTADGYVRSTDVRPKVGDDTPKRKMFVVDCASGAGVEVKTPKGCESAAPERPRWSPDGRFLLATARSDDDEHAFLLKVDPVLGDVAILDALHDPAWVHWTALQPEFLGRTSTVYYLSEKSGYSHVQVADLETGEVRAITSGRYEVWDPRATPDGTRLYAIATPTSPHVRDLVEIDPTTGSMTLLSADGGGRSFTLSPDGRVVAEVFSNANKPWELRLRWLDGTREPVVVTDSPSPAFKSYEGWESPPIVTFKALDGTLVPARIFRPRADTAHGAAVLFVHGAGYLQNVHQWWSSYQREFAFHHLLREQGYVVLDVDYRGSAGYGRDWRCAIRTHMGGRDLLDFVDAAAWLVAQEGVQREKVGIYGGSYGGFITLMGLFTKPGVFRAGAALRPVTDWAHYNDPYTSNILDDPMENEVAYQRSSPINFAEGLADHLLICHGILDSNVHVQDVIRLQQRLIELRKNHWEVALYPLEGHGFRDPASWTDEYRRIKSLFDRVLR